MFWDEWFRFCCKAYEHKVFKLGLANSAPGGWNGTEQLYTDYLEDGGSPRDILLRYANNRKRVRIDNKDNDSNDSNDGSNDDIIHNNDDENKDPNSSRDECEGPVSGLEVCRFYMIGHVGLYHRRTVLETGEQLKHMCCIWIQAWDAELEAYWSSRVGRCR